MTNETKVGNYRWVIASLLLFSTTINYMDRQVISYVKDYFCTPIAKGGFGWTDNQYSYVTACFTLFYAAVTVFAGLVIDKIGTKNCLIDLKQAIQRAHELCHTAPQIAQ